MPQFVKYRSIDDKVFATELYKELSENGIEVEWESAEGFFDPSFVTNEVLFTYYIKLRPEDFSKADQILEKLMSSQTNAPLEDYYLYTFSNEELLDVLKKPDEWNEYDRFWAKKILFKKGIEIKEEELLSMKDLRVQELKKPWKTGRLWILMVIIFIILACRYLHIFSAFGLIFLGLYLAYSKRTILTGERIWAFDKTDRMLGKMILVIGIICNLFILLIAFGVLNLDWFSFIS